MTQKTKQRRMEMHVPSSSHWRDVTGVLFKGELDRPTVTVWLDAPWIAVVTIGAEPDGALVVAGVEIRLRPAEMESDVDPARQTIVPPGLPVGGLPLRVLRSLTFGDVLDFARECLARAGDYVLSRHGLSRTTLDAVRRPGKTGRPDRYYAEIADAYVRALDRGSRRPVVDAADELSEARNAPYSSAYVRAALHVARTRGLLSPSRRGVSGGALTLTATRLLASPDERP